MVSFPHCARSLLLAEGFCTALAKPRPDENSFLQYNTLLHVQDSRCSCSGCLLLSFYQVSWIVHQGRPKHARRWDPSNLGDRVILGEVSLCSLRRLRGAEVMKKLLALEPHVLRRIIGWLPLHAFKAAWLVLATVANASQRSRTPGSKKQGRETWSRLGRPAC